tara:strand:+ start:65 stop:388 length:324 start_codon:yes stop_codon:yes gene_type:complete
MSPIEKQLNEAVNKAIKEAPKGLDEAGLTGWVIDKVSNGLKWATNKKADYQYDGFIKSKEFRGLAKHYNMSERDWDKKARQLMKKDPKRFADILMYDLRKRKISKYF